MLLTYKKRYNYYFIVLNIKISVLLNNLKL
jgi:hypothetical protein